MSVIEDILSKVVTKALEGKGGDDKKSSGGSQSEIIKALIPVVIALISSGGLKKILDAMKQQGLTDEADSWVGSGENKSISPEDAKKVVGDDMLKDIAGKIGLPEDETADIIAKALPEVVDKTSPEGTEPAEEDVGKLLKDLTS